MQAAVRFEQHGRPHSDLMTWLGNYRAVTPGVEVGDNTTIRLDQDNEPQPDAFLRIAPSHGGQSRTGDDGVVDGPPELIAKVAASSASYDLHDKLNVYRRNGVREYIVWKVLEREVVWFHLCDERFEQLQRDDAGLFKSEAFPGLWLDSANLVAGEMAQVLQVLQSGLTTSDHAEFVVRLQQEADKRAEKS